MLQLERWESDWVEDDVFSEIRSVFSAAMDNDPQFPFQILLPTGSGRKSLAVHLYLAHISGPRKK